MTITAQRKTRATAEPLTTAEVKTHLRVDHAIDDTYIDTLIVAATDYTEQITGRALVQGTFDMYLDTFPQTDATAIMMPFPPLISVTSIKYWDENDTEQTWDSAEYVVDTNNVYLCAVYPGRNYAWPSTRIFPKAVHIEYIAGYDDSNASPVDLADNVPQTLKHALLLLIGHWYENRELTTAGIEIKNVPTAYDALINPHKVMRF